MRDYCDVVGPVYWELGGGGSGLVIVNARSTELAKAVVVSLAEIIRQS